MSWETSNRMDGIDSSDDEAVSTFLLANSRSESTGLPLHERDSSSDESDSLKLRIHPVGLSNGEDRKDHQKSMSPSVNTPSHSKKLRRTKLVARKLTMKKIPSRKSFLALQNANAEEVEDSKPSLVLDLYKRQIDPMNGNVLSPVSFINVVPFHHDTTNLNKSPSCHEKDEEIDNVVDKLIVPCLLNSKSGWNVSSDKNQFTLNMEKSSLKVPRKRIFDLVTKKSGHYECHDLNEKDSIVTGLVEEDILSSMVDRSTAIATSIESSLKRVTDDDEEDEMQPIISSRKRKVDEPKSQKSNAKKRKDIFVLAKQSYPKFVQGKNTLFFDSATLDAIAKKVFLESFGEKSTINQSKVLIISMEDSPIQALTTVITVKGRQDLVEKAKAKLNDHVIQIIACENIARLTKGQLEIDIKLDVTQNLGADFVKGGKQLGIFVKDFKQNSQLERIFGRQMKSGIALMKMRRQSQGEDQSIEKLKDKNRILNQAKESYAKSKEETDKWVIANFRLERESDLSGLDIASVVLRNRTIQGIRLVEGSTPQEYRELNERIHYFHNQSAVHDPKRINNTEPKSKSSSQSSSRQGYANAFEKFRDKMQGVYEVEFKHLKFNANGIYSIMWEEHQRRIGKECESNCKCPSIVPQLAFNLVEKYCKNRKKSDPSWKPKQEVDLKKEVGFVRWFYPRFYQKVNDELGGLNPLANLEILLKMWRFHKKQMRYSDTCSSECDCRSGWDFFKKELHREQSMTIKKSQKATKPSQNSFTIQEKKVIFNPSKEDLGFYCFTDSNQVLIKSVNPTLRKSAGISVGSSITSFEVIAPYSTKKILMSHKQLRNIYENLKTQNNHTKLALWFKSPNTSRSRNCGLDWDERGAWIGKHNGDGWAGGAMTTVSKFLSADNNSALAIQSKKSSRIVPPSLKKQSRTENGLVSQILDTLDQPWQKSKAIHDTLSREKRSPPSFDKTHLSAVDFSKRETVHQGVELFKKNMPSKKDVHMEAVDEDLFPNDEDSLEISRTSVDNVSSVFASNNAHIEIVDEDLFPDDDSHEDSTIRSSSASAKPKSLVAANEESHVEKVDEDLFPDDNIHAGSAGPFQSVKSNKGPKAAAFEEAHVEKVDEDLFPDDNIHAGSAVPFQSVKSNKGPKAATFEEAHVEKVDEDLFPDDNIHTESAQPPQSDEINKGPSDAPKTDSRPPNCQSILKRGVSNPIKKRVAFGENTTQLFWASPDSKEIENQVVVLPLKKDSDFSRGIKELSLPIIINAFNADHTRDLTDFMRDVKRKRESIKNEMKKMDDMIRRKELNDLFKKYQVIDSLLKTYSKIQSTLKKASAVIKNTDINRIITAVDIHKDEFTERLSTIVQWFRMLKVNAEDLLQDTRTLHANIVLNGINLLHVAIYVYNAPLITELVHLGLSVDASSNVLKSPRVFANELYLGATEIGELVEPYKKVVEAINEI